MTEDRNEGVASGEPMHGDDQTILMESGSIRSDGNCDECRVSRGMPAISIDGQEVGWVAAVVIDAEGASTAIVMARPQTTLEYYLLHLVPWSCFSRRATSPATRPHRAAPS